MKTTLAIFFAACTVTFAQTNQVPPKVAVPVKPVEPKRVVIQKIIADWGFKKCQTDKGIYLIKNLPAETINRMTRVSQLQDQVDKQVDFIAGQKKYNSEAQALLSKLRKQLADAKAEVGNYNAVNIIPTVQNYGADKVWLCQGLAQD